MTQTPFFSPSHGIHTARAIYALGLKKTKLFSPRSLLSHGFLMCIVKQKSQTLELNQIFANFTVIRLHSLSPCTSSFEAFLVISETNSPEPKMLETRQCLHNINFLRHVFFF